MRRRTVTQRRRFAGSEAAILLDVAILRPGDEGAIPVLSDVPVAVRPFVEGPDGLLFPTFSAAGLHSIRGQRTADPQLLVGRADLVDTSIVTRPEE
jgi:hypothetical protein